MSDEQSPAERLRLLEERLPILEALARVLDDPHGFVDIVLSGDNVAAAIEGLRAAYNFTEVQATAALDMQFRRLSTLDRAMIRRYLQEARSERDRPGDS